MTSRVPLSNPARPGSGWIGLDFSVVEDRISGMQRFPFMAALVLAATLLPFPSQSIAGPNGVGTSKDFHGPVGLQLYSLRAEFIRYGVPKSLDVVKKYGIQQVELAGTYNLPPEKFRGMLEERGLKAVSGHFSYNQWKNDIPGIIKEAKALGLKYAGCAWAGHKTPYDMEDCKANIEVFNKAGAALAKEGIQFFYHPHGFEFQPHGDGTLLDYLIQNTHKDHVAFEMDVFWVVHPGHNPVSLLRKYEGRWKLMHVKDMRKGVETGVLTGKSDVKNDVIIGTGQMNWKKIMKTAQEVGVEVYFIEDESPTAETNIPRSLKYLGNLNW